jgi:hypothetical protein
VCGSPGPVGEYTTAFLPFRESRVAEKFASFIHDWRQRCFFDSQMVPDSCKTP